MVNPIVVSSFLLFIRVIPRIHLACISFAPKGSAFAARQGESGLIRENLILEFQNPPVAEVNAGR
jgi:hypothetical protein